jgi:geranylgeranyl pyrophosphate synthase
MIQTAALPHEPPLTPARRLDFEFEPVELARNLGGGALELPVELWRRALLDPLHEFLSRPGKEFRASLVESAWALAGGRGELPQEAPLLVELLHAGSLIIDDIEDRSSSRRGRPALHTLVGEPLAINLGNWLYFYAEQLAGRMGLPAALELELRRAMSSSLTRCHYGQALDLSVHIGALTQAHVPAVVRETARLKTGGLFALSARVGAIAARAEDGASAALSDFGESLGIALQMLDDLSGLFVQRRCHKGHEDLIHGRPTFPWAWLAEELDELSYSRLQCRAREVEQHELHPEVLAELIREKLDGRGELVARRHLTNALVRLRQQFGASPALHALEAELRRLEKAYG